MGLGGAALRDAEPGSWGIGDLADLRAVRQMAADQGAGFVLINPLHAVAPTAGQEASPYLPATRRFRNPIYLRVAEVPGADGVDLEDDAGRKLNDGPLIDRDAIWARKREVLMRIFFAHGGGEAFAAGARSRGRPCRTGPPGPRSPRSTAATGTPGPRSCAVRRARSWRPTSSSTAPSWRSTPGCSGRWTCSSPPRPTA